MDQEELAVEELKLAQAAIHKQDDLRFKIIGWCVIFFTGLTVAFLSEDMPVGKSIYLVVGAVGIVAFGILDVLHKVAQDRAIKRYQCIEEGLRTVCTYDGPCLGDRLAEKVTPSALWKASKNARVFGPYLALAFSLCVIALVGPSSDEEATVQDEPPETVRECDNGAAQSDALRSGDGNGPTPSKDGQADSGQ